MSPTEAKTDFANDPLLCVGDATAGPALSRCMVNLRYREEEREMLPLCAAEGVSVIPWSPQARGKLTYDWDYKSIRTETDEAMTRLFAKTEEADRGVVDRVAAGEAGDHGADRRRHKTAASRLTRKSSPSMDRTFPTPS